MATTVFQRNEVAPFLRSGKISRGMNSFRIPLEFLQPRQGLSFGEILNLFVKSHCSRRRGRPAHCAGTVLRQEQKPQLSAKGPSSTRAKYLALSEGTFFNESQIFDSQRRSAPTPNDGACCDGKRAFDESQIRLSAHIR
jgi:hypothetical protein